MPARSSVRDIATIVASACCALALLGASATPIIVDGAPLPASAISDVGGKTYVVLRAIGDAFGAQVSYDGRQRQATFTTEFREVVLIIGKAVAIVDGQSRPVDAPAQLIDGKVMVPLRVVAQTLGASITYDAQRRAIIVSTSGVNAPPRGVPTAPAVPSTNTIEGTVTDVETSMVPPSVA